MRLLLLMHVIPLLLRYVIISHSKPPPVLGQQLEDVPVDGFLTISLAFKTGGKNCLLLFMRETSVGHNISLFLSDGALKLFFYPDTLIVPASKKTGEKILYNDNQWHEVLIVLGEIRGAVKYVTLETEEVSANENVENLPLLTGAKYETFIDDILSSEMNHMAIRDININERPITFTLYGAFVGMWNKWEDSYLSVVYVLDLFLSVVYMSSIFLSQLSLTAK